MGNIKELRVILWKMEKVEGDNNYPIWTDNFRYEFGGSNIMQQDSLINIHSTGGGEGKLLYLLLLWLINNLNYLVSYCFDSSRVTNQSKVCSAFAATKNSYVRSYQKKGNKLRSITESYYTTWWRRVRTALSICLPLVIVSVVLSQVWCYRKCGFYLQGIAWWLITSIHHGMKRVGFYEWIDRLFIANWRLVFNY